jgi:hypothetical protein
MKRMFLSAVVPVMLSGGACAEPHRGALAQEVARESLDLLKEMAVTTPTARTYLGTCVTAIARAKRLEAREDSLPDVIDGSWRQAAGQCRGMANVVCDVEALEAPRPACNRIRAYQSLM